MVPMNDTPSPGPRIFSRGNVLWSVVLLTAVAVSFIAGALTAKQIIIDRVNQYVHQPERLPEPITQLLQERLGLTDEQSDLVYKVFENRIDQYKQVERGVTWGVNVLLDNIDRDIRAILDERQLAKWDAMFAGIREQWIPQRQ